MPGTAPRVTVLMPVYNAGPYLASSVESVLAQTFADFELLAIDDGSTDASLDVLRSFDDPRMRIERNGANMGLIATLNKGLDLARGEFVARMDADDLAHPSRLDRQVALMDANPGLGACGMFIETFGSARPRIVRYPVESQAVQCHLLGYTPMAHPTVVFRKPLLDRHALRYDREYPHAEDYDLLERASCCFAMANIPKVGLRYRLHATQVSRVHHDIMQDSVARIRARRMARLTGGDSSRTGSDMIDMFFNTERRVTLGDIAAARDWMEAVLESNRRLSLYDQAALQAFLADRWLNLCNRATEKRMQLWRSFRSSPAGLVAAGSRFGRIKLFAKCLLPGIA